MAKDFRTKLAAALSKMKEGAGSAEIPLDEDDLDGLGMPESLKTLLMGGQDKRPTDDTPVSATVITDAINILASLTNETSTLDDYVRAFNYSVLLHGELHDAPVMHTKLHEHVINLGSAIEAIAQLRFGDEAFNKAVNAAKLDIDKTFRAKATDELLSDAPPAFHKMRPKNRAN